MRPKRTASEQLARIRTALLLDEPFWGTLLMRLKPVEDPSCRSMWSDSVTLGYNPQFVLDTREAEVRGVLAKLVMHICAGHAWRQGVREAAMWNEACSLAVNPYLREAGFSLPEDCRIDPRFTGQFAEGIYATLQAEEKPPEPPPLALPSAAGEASSQEPSADDAAAQNSPDSGEAEQDPEATPGQDAEGPANPGESPDSRSPRPEPQSGEIRQAPARDPDLPQEDYEQQASDWKQAMAHAKEQQGMLPAKLRSLVENRLLGEEDWKSKLRSLLEQTLGADDYSWSSPATSYLHLGLYLPSLRGERLPSLVVVRDSSGSVSNKMRARFNGEIQDIVQALAPEELFVLDADAAVARVQSLQGEEVEEFDDGMCGGGGTDFRPALRWAETNVQDCKCLIYLTDLLGTFPDQEPPFPVIWVVASSHETVPVPPFGETVRVNIEDMYG